MARITATLTIAASAIALVAAHDGHDHGPSSHTGMNHTEAGACAANVSASVIAVVENVTFFDTCAKDSTFKFTSLLDAMKLPATEFFQFCNSLACLGPLHTVMHDAPLTCLITYKGSAQNLTGEITELHDKCHEVKDAAKAAAKTSNSSSSATAANSTVATTPTPSPSSAATSSLMSSKTLAVAIAGVTTLASLLI